MVNYGEFKRFIEDTKDGYGWFMKELDGEEVPERIWKRNVEQAVKEGLLKEVTTSIAIEMELHQISIIDDYPECENSIVYITI